MEYKSEELSSESSHVDDATNLIINYLPVDLDESNLKVLLYSTYRIVIVSRHYSSCACI